MCVCVCKDGSASIIKCSVFNPQNLFFRSRLSLNSTNHDPGLEDLVTSSGQSRHCRDLNGRKVTKYIEFLIVLMFFVTAVVSPLPPGFLEGK